MSKAEQRLRKALENIAEQNSYENAEITLKVISSEGANYTSLLFVGIIKSQGKDDINLFVKSANIGPQLRETLQLNPFTIERYFYTNLAKEFAELEEKYNIPKEFKLKYPKYYGSNLTELEETMILENMLISGYEPFNRFKPVDKNYAFEAVKTLARFHALSIAFSTKKPEEFERFCEYCPQNALEQDAIAKVIEESIKASVSFVSEKNRHKFEIFLPNLSMKKIQDLLKPLKRPVITHNDYRPSNMLHKIKKNGEYDIVVVDYQTLVVGCGVNDLQYFIFSGTDEEFRRKYYNDLLELYYIEISAQLKRLNINADDVYPKEDFQFELKERTLYGLIMGLFTLRVVLVEPKNAPDIGSEDIDFSSMMVVQGSDLYIERMNGVINDFVKWGFIV